MSFALSGIGRRANDQQARQASATWTSVKFSMVMGKAYLFLMIALLSISGYFCTALRVFRTAVHLAVYNKFCGRGADGDREASTASTMPKF
jgi:hypothetical protein